MNDVFAGYQGKLMMAVDWDAIRHLERVTVGWL